MAIEQAYKFNISHIRIYSDSKFVINLATKWIKKWEKNKFLKKDGSKVSNLDDIKKLTNLCKLVTISWVHVKGMVNKY